MVVLLVDDGGSPGGIIEVLPLEADLRRPRVVFLQKLGCVSHGVRCAETRMEGGSETCVALDNGSAVGDQIQNQTMAKVAALPDAVHEPLIERVHRDDVFAGPQPIGDFKHIVAVAEMIGRCRPLRDECPVDPKFVVVICRDEDLGPFRLLVEKKSFSIEHMSVSMLRVWRFDGGCQLSVEDIFRRKRCEFRSGDPFSLKVVVHAV